MVRSIKLLDDNTINKIAAGEVVERPASVIKELLENSIDANASSITIEILEGGKSYIRVTDNGNGINRADIECAFLRHSTSKIRDAEDLSCIETLGFRGEALASISAISRIELITKTSEDASGIKTLVNGGVLKSQEDIGCPDGTTIIIRKLFYNTPVRQKFLKSDSTEARHIGDIVYKLALSNPHISFNYIKDNKSVMKTPGKGNLESTVYSVLGRDFVDDTFSISNECDGINLHGLIGKPEYTRSNRNSQYLFINGRYIKDSCISSIIEKSYSTLVTVKRYPVFLLFIKIDPSKIDINVHPTKTEVRFTNRDILNKFITDSIKSVLYSENLIPNVDLSDTVKKNKQMQLDKEEQVILDSLSSDTKVLIDSNTNKDNDLLKVVDFSSVDKVIKDRDIKPIEDIQQVKVPKQEAQKLYEDKSDKVSENKCLLYDDTPIVRVPEIEVLGSLFDTYILGQSRENKLFYMIDQHAAHERIMYEKLKNQFLSRKVDTQMLVATDVLELSLSDVDIIKDNIEIFSDLGFEIENFGTNAIALRGVPLVFGKPNSKELFLDILDNLDSNPNSNYEFQLDKIMKLACTAAIKANDNLEDIEIEKLIEDLRKTKQPFTCPHGRPVIIEMTKQEIEKKFKRT